MNFKNGKLSKTDNRIFSYYIIKFYGEINENIGCLCGRRGRNWWGRVTWKLSLMMYFDRSWITQVCTFVRTHWMLYFRFMHFIMCKLYLKGKKFKRCDANVNDLKPPLWEPLDLTNFRNNPFLPWKIIIHILLM